MAVELRESGCRKGKPRVFNPRIRLYD